MPRPRIHPEGSTAANRRIVSDARLKAAGGAIRQFRLSKPAIDAIAALRERWGLQNDTQTIERVLAEARK
jgi:hypothetical protein